MTHLKSFLRISFFAILLQITACKKDDNSSSSPSNNSILQQGNWKVSSYIDSGADETYHYTNYTFQFSSNGTISASNSTSNVSGTWSIGTDDSQQKLILSFGTSPFDELNDDWHIVSQSSSQIKLEDVSGGNGGTDYLSFEKI